MCPHADLDLGRARELDEQRQLVRDETEQGVVQIRYRTLVVAVDAVSRVLPIPGLAEYGLGFRYKGIAYVLGVPLRGFLGWFVTRTYHLCQLPLLSRKLRVVTDWTVSLFFRRDIAELGMLEQPKGLADE